MGNPMSERIARIIEAMIEENGGDVELQRNKLAIDVGCVPSQINYVITSRFGTDRGYIVESRRGGGGYIKITKVNFDSKNAYLMHMFSSVGSEIDERSARVMCASLYDNSLITGRELKIMLCAISERALGTERSPDVRGMLRADIMKSFILAIKD